MRRLPEHPKAGLLWWTLRISRLSWLERAIPEDFYQECALFLLGWGPDPDPQEFCRAAARYFYDVAVAYGWKRPKNSGRYQRLEKGLDPAWAEEEGYDDSRNRTLLDDPWPNWEESQWVREKLKFCRRVLLGPGGNGSKRAWYGFQAYLSGCSLSEIAFLTGWTPSLVKEHLKIAIRKIRQAAGVNPNLPFPSMPKRGKVEFRQGREVGAGPRPNPGKGRVLVSPGLSVEQIMERYGVSRASAFRAKKRGWLEGREQWSQKGDPFEPYRVTLDRELTIRDIQARFGISQRKAYGAKKRGWVIDQEKIRNDPLAPKKVKQWLRLVESQKGGKR